jgi:hypothetical protein
MHKLPDNIKSLEELRVERDIVRRKDGNQLFYHLSLPTLNLSAPTVPPKAAESSEGMDVSTPAKDDDKKPED